MTLEERITLKISKSYTSCFSLFANNGDTHLPVVAYMVDLSISPKSATHSILIG
jgi:hypothetical protein